MFQFFDAVAGFVETVVGFIVNMIADVYKRQIWYNLFMNDRKDRKATDRL